MGDMMKYAVISDIHANKFALNALYKDLEKKNVNEIICLGDLVTKYQYPKEVIDEIRKTAKIVVIGNCDYNVVAHDTFEYTRKSIGIDGIDYLRNLKHSDSLIINDVLCNFFHATKNSLDNMFNPLFDNSNTLYKDKIVTDYHDMLIGNMPQVNFVGHTHQDYVLKFIGNGFKLRNYIYGTKMYFSKYDKAIINVGSVGDNISIIEKNNEYIDVLKPYFTYAIISGDFDYGIEVTLEKVNYKRALKKLYYDLKKLKKEKNIPVTNSHYKKIEGSYNNMCGVIRKKVRGKNE